MSAALVLGAPPAPWTVDDFGPLTVVVVGLGFLIAERFIFTIEYQREALGVSLSEIPIAFTLVMLSPMEAVLAALVGGLTGWWTSQPSRPPLLKLLFNGSLFAADVALASTVFLVSVNAVGRADPAVLLVLLVPAILVSSLFRTTVTSAIIALHEGGFGSRVLASLRQRGNLFLVGAVLGATAVAPSLISPWLVVLPLLPIIMFWRLLVRLGDLNQRHRDLSAVHEFTRAVNNSLHLSSVVMSAQEHSQRLLRAAFAGLVVFPTEPADAPIIAATASGGALPLDPDDPRWRDLLTSSGSVVRLGRDGAEDHPLVQLAGWNEALVAPLRDGEGLLGVLVVADRIGAQARFSRDDVQRMRAIGDQLAVSLRKGLLHIRVEHEATHDRLTGLPNRSIFERELQYGLRDSSVAVYLLDLDRFKEVNDGLGHHVGDLLLQRFADRMRGELGPGVVISRLAGDEFAVLAFDVSRSEAFEMGSRMLSLARRPFDLGKLSVAVSCSIGLAYGPDHGRDAVTLLRRADLAMYEAKGRSGGVSIFRLDLESSSKKRLRLLQDLRAAAVGEEMQPYYQPQIDLRTGMVIGAEALVRWDHPERGILKAEMFVALAEQTDLIHLLTDHMLGSALRAARAWRAGGWDLGVAVNVSARSLLDELLADRIARHLHHADVPPRLLTIEITETSVMADVSRALATLTRLHDLGVQVSVDDYGTGYSSLTYLRRLPVNELKVDRGFIANVLADEHDEVIVRSTIDLGRHLGLRVVAEGIETPEVADRLQLLGCDIGQGSGFAPPLPLPEFHVWLESSGFPVRRVEGPPRLATA
jgi:diguanylate cyclase (GGDEF)-like protein